MNIETFDIDQFAALILDRLGEAYRKRPEGETPHLILRKDQSPSWAPPADVLASFAYGLSATARPRFVGGLSQALRQARPEILPAGAVEDLILSVGLLQATEALLPAARALGDARQWGPELKRLQQSLLMVLKGLAGTNSAYEATRLLVGYRNFSNGLILDALQILIQDDHRIWSKGIEEVESRLLQETRLNQRFFARLGMFARGPMSALSDVDIADGLSSLAKDRLRLDITHPVGVLMTALVEPPEGPFRIIRDSIGTWFESRLTGTRVDWNRVPSELSLFLGEHWILPHTPGLSEEAQAQLRDFDASLHSEPPERIAA